MGTDISTHLLIPMEAKPISEGTLLEPPFQAPCNEGVFLARPSYRSGWSYGWGDPRTGSYHPQNEASFFTLIPKDLFNSPQPVLPCPFRPETCGLVDPDTIRDAGKCRMGRARGIG
jgi:hypothetical protein